MDTTTKPTATFAVELLNDVLQRLDTIRAEVWECSEVQLTDRSAAAASIWLASMAVSRAVAAMEPREVAK